MLLPLSGLSVGQEALSLKTHIALPNVNGRMDHFSADVKGQRLFVSALGNSTVEVLDVQAGQRLRTIPGLDEPQGLFYEASSNRLFVASGGDGTTKIYDGTTFQLVATVKFSADADNIRFDPRNRRVIVGYGGEKALRLRPSGSGALGFLDTNGKQLGEIAMDAHPESFQLERNGTRVFVNVPDKKEIQVADLEKNTIVARWPTTAGSCFPMALDEAHNRLFAGCRSPARLLVINTANGATVASPEIVGDTDDLFFDAARSRVYVIGGQGFIDVLQQKDADHYDRIARYPTPAGTRTGLFVPEWGKLFAAVPHRGEQQAKIRVFEAK
jgi:DNA-binding beta-propeller fold protein YncE